MTTGPDESLTEPLSDEDITSSENPATGSAPQPGTDTDATDADGTDGTDGTDADGTDSADADATDADGTDGTDSAAL